MQEEEFQEEIQMGHDTMKILSASLMIGDLKT